MLLTYTYTMLYIYKQHPADISTGFQGSTVLTPTLVDIGKIAEILNILTQHSEGYEFD